MAFLSFGTDYLGATPPTLDVGAYVTDGTHLFRVVVPMRPLCGRFSAMLEDCVTLESRSYTAADLYHMRVRLVRGTASRE
jgi:hypothetical protein